MVMLRGFFSFLEFVHVRLCGGSFISLKYSVPSYGRNNLVSTLVDSRDSDLYFALTSNFGKCFLAHNSE